VRACLIAIATIVATVGLIAPSSAGPQWTARPLKVIGTPIQASKALSTRLAQSDRQLLRMTGTKPVPVMVKFDYDAVASYHGGVQGLAATSPEVTGKPLSKAGSAVAAYERYLAQRESEILGRISAAIPGAVVLRTYRIAYGGAAMQVPANRIRDLLSVPGVVAVQEDGLEQPQTDATPILLGAVNVWGKIGGKVHAGENVLVGDLDTGIWPESPTMKDKGLAPPPGTYACQFGDGSDPLLGDPFTCNNKLVGAYAFTDTYMSLIGALPGEFCDNDTGVCSARDADGHGTHTLSTAAGVGVKDASIFGIDRGDISGMAPGAHVIMYRVCLDQGCYQSDSVAAIEQAILDGVNVINFSISGGADAYSDAVELAFLDAYAAGISVNASAGNAGPDSGTSDHAGGWVDTVAASTSQRQWQTTLHLSSPTGAVDVVGVSITPGISTDTPVILSDDVPGYPADSDCLDPFDPGAVTGMVVACEGEFSRNLRANNVMNGGGVGMILFSTDPAANLFTDNFWVPTVMAVRDQGQLVSDFLAANTDVVAHWDTGQYTPIKPDVVTGFSSRGPVGDFVKPDIAAPGIEILAGHTPQPVSVFGGPPGEYFQVIAGTSMAAPHATGVAALVKAVHPDWTPGQIKSALMTSAVQAYDSDGVTPADPFVAGAGAIRANLAVNPTLTFDVSAADYYAAASDPAGRVNLNLPSVNVPVMPGIFTTTRTGLNVSGMPQAFDVSIQSPPGATITTVPAAHFTVAAGATKTIQITINGEQLAEGQYFGRITLTPHAYKTVPVTIPVAFVKTQGNVTLANTCNDASIPLGGTTSCAVTMQNYSPAPANVHLDTLGPKPTNLLIDNVSAPGVQSGNGFTFDGALSAASAPPIESITSGGSPAGYLPLALFGVTPIPGMGDETLANIGVPNFLFGDETYNTVAMVSDGYAVVGGGDSQDINFVPQSLPDLARPNNVLAPFWTDLNPAFGGDMYVAELTDGVNVWVVMEWAGVPDYTTGLTQSFQIWVQEGSTESVTYAFGDVNGVGDPGVGLTVGAENRDGSSGVMLGSVPPTGSDYTITAGSPIPGGALTITYDATGLSKGKFGVVARLQSDVTPGTTSEVVFIRVG
jgi:subtilisin family serine protease